MSDEPRSMANLQEADYGADRDYEYGSPHLLHNQLRSRIEDSVTRLVRDIVADHGSCHVLEVGAGHGSFTDTMVAAGAKVTVTEMSAPSMAVLERKFADTD